MPQHHYVPQFYLKRFGNGKHISTVLMDHGFRFVEKASIRNQSCRPDYYQFPEVEKFISEIEQEASFLMRTIVQRLPLTVDQTDYIKRYVAFQMMRTPAYIQEIENVMSASLSSLYRAMSEEGQGFEEMKTPVKVSGAKVWVWKHLYEMCNHVTDLDLKFLVSKRNGFLSSDQPVSSYNPWALKGKFAGQGFGCRGLMLFLPIDSQITVMLYDSEVYTFRTKDRRSTYISIERGDEERLNKLQMTGCRSALYLPCPGRHPAVQTLARKVRSTYPPVSGEPEPTISSSEDGRSQIHVLERQSINFGEWSFLYESKGWRKVAYSARGFGIYGSRDTTPDAGLRMLMDTRPWNSTRYVDEEGIVSYLRTSLYDPAR